MIEESCVVMDSSRDALITDFGKETLKDRYLLSGETPQQGLARAALAYSDNLDHAQRLYDYASKQWFMFSTPILSNAGTTRGLPISCFLSAVGDSRQELMDHYTELAFLSSVGGGTAGYWGSIRSDGVGTSSGSKSTGSIPFLKVVDSEIQAFHQGSTRRGSYAAYQNINHPEIEEFIFMRKSTGDTNRKCLNLHHGVNLTNDFMRAVEKGSMWDLIDPHSKKVTKQVDARELFHSILETRIQTGEPYINFIDTINDKCPEAYKEHKLTISQSNLCTEIMMPTTPERTAVCCLSSVNLDKFDEWVGNTDFIEDLIRMLDNVLTVFIDKAPPQLWRAVKSCIAERSIGLGAMGFHSYLQRNNLPFESALSSGVNRKMFLHLKEKAQTATETLAKERGKAPEALESDPVRNVQLIAIAPNASSSIICGNVSPSIEPFRANAYTQKTTTGSSLHKNPNLEMVLETYGKNDKKTWQSIIVNKGSVQQLDWLSDWHKDVFKTAIEIDQNWIIEHAAVRQEWVCQSQSLNLFFTPNVEKKYIHSVHMKAWRKGIKSLYYLRSESMGSAEVVSKKVNGDSECLACQA